MICAKGVSTWAGAAMVRAHVLATAAIIIGWCSLAAAQTNLIVNNPPPYNKAQGSVPILTNGGFSLPSNDNQQFNYVPYVSPGMVEGAAQYPCQQKENIYLPGEPFELSYANPGTQPVQSSDWWSSLGFQLDGWVLSRGNRSFPNECDPPTTRHAQTQAFYSEPFQFNFVDYVGGTPSQQPSIDFPDGFTPEAGLAIWNLNTFQVATNAQLIVGKKLLGFNTNYDLTGYGSPAPDFQARLTIGLEDTSAHTTMHPLRADEFPNGSPNDGRWTNVQVESYSDWGVVASVHDKTNANKLQITMANGSPFVWLERTNGSDAFDVWVGGIPLPGDKFGTFKLVENTGTTLIVQITTFFNGLYFPPDAGPTTSDAFYAIEADQGKWERVTSETKFPNVAEFQNTSATSVIVTALPHNIAESAPIKADETSSSVAWATLKPYACVKTVNTKLILPTPPETTTVGNQTFKLGYDLESATVTASCRLTPQWCRGSPVNARIRVSRSNWCSRTIARS
jgi:hypothetical protein